MSKDIDRRSLLKRSIAGSAAAALSLSFEEQALLAKDSAKSAGAAPGGAIKGLPTGKIKDITISRLIVGGNLTSGFAHSRDLIYVSSLLRSYFTDDKIFETWELCEECGINTAILRLDDHVVRLLNAYRSERGGKIQWIVQIKPDKVDLQHFKDYVKRSVDNGAVGGYVQGGVGDALVKNNDMDLLAEILQCIKDAGVIAGIGSHSLEVPIACEKAGLKPDFYMKTLHSPKYWSYNPRNEKWDKFHTISGQGYHDNVWCTRAEEAIEFMSKVDTPLIAFKVLAAGAIHPSDGFKYAYENGADFICAGMFDFQVREDVIIAKDTLSGRLNRTRPWRA